MKGAAQQGAVLVMSLIMLAVMTLLAISSARDSLMQTRVMAKELDYQRLFNLAEASLREAERHIAKATAPLPPCGEPPCLQGLATHNAVDFSHASPYQGLTDKAARARWYIRQIQSVASQPEDARYGAAAQPSGTYFYEVSSQAFYAEHARTDLNRICTGAAVCLRSVVARTFIPGQP
jgi:type IV pilus assembly protein PilX